MTTITEQKTIVQEVKSNENVENVKKDFKERLKILIEIHWHTAIVETLVYVYGVVGFYHLITGQWKWMTIPWSKLNFFIEFIERNLRFSQ